MMPMMPMMPEQVAVVCFHIFTGDILEMAVTMCTYICLRSAFPVMEVFTEEDAVS